MSITYPTYPNTVFPDAVQTFAKYLDITQSDVGTYNRAVEAMMAGNLSLAQSLLSSIPNINQKALTAEKLNRLIDTVQALQKYYAQDLTTKVSGYQTTWQNIINKFEYKGTWKSGVYDKNNMVSYASSATNTDQTLFLYIATKAITASIGNPYNDYENAIAAGIQPNWYRITIRGQQGTSGDNLVNFRFTWNNTTAYAVNDIVTYQNKWWIAVTANTAVAPSPTASQWNLVLDGNLVSQYPIQTAQPADSAQQTGDLWFQII